MYKRIYLLVLTVGILAGIVSGKKTVIADAADRSPVTGATVINRAGLITGFSDKEGNVEIGTKDLPVTVRCMGYESGVMSLESDTLFLTPATYSLNEVVVSPGERPVTRVVTYAREYASGSTSEDTLQIYSEYMLEYFFADGKVKGFSKSHQSPHVLAVRRYARIDTPEIPDSLFRPKENDDITFLSFLSNLAFVPYEKHKVPEPLTMGAKGVRIDGKYGPAREFRYQNDLYIQTYDPLSEYKDHRWSPWFFKMLGMTIDMEEYDWAIVYKRNDNHEYGIDDFVSGRYNMKTKARGKLFKYLLKVKEGIDMNCLIEQYPVTIERLTADEYKEYKKDYDNRQADFELPPHTEPLPAPIQRLLDRF